MPKIPRQAIVDRARSAIGRRTVYVLSAGGRDPAADHPAMKVEHQGGLVWGCDCTGFEAWGYGVDRYLLASENKSHPLLERYPFGEWFESSALVKDAHSSKGFVDQVPWAAALPGDALMWGDRIGTDHVKHQGHVGIVATVDGKGPLTVVHCSSGNFRISGDAIQETDCGVFLRNGAIAAIVDWVTA